jgi:uncharacterized protein
MTAKAFQRSLPRLSDENRFFWTSGADGRLRFRRCRDCGYWQHPPSPVCPHCLSANVAPEAVSGKGVVKSFTVNHQAWVPGLEAPYIIALIALREQDDLQLTSNLIAIPAAEVRIGQRVRVVFEKDEDVWVPLFEPDPDA